MCMGYDPLSAVLGATLGVARAVTTHSRGEAEQRAREQTAANEAAMTEYQARLKDHQARLNTYDADKAKRDAAREHAARDGVTRSLLATRGVELDGGSALDVLVDSARRRAEDLFAIDDDAERKNAGLRYESSLLRAQAKSKIEAAKDRRSAVEKGFGLFDTFAPSIGRVGTLFS